MDNDITPTELAAYIEANSIDTGRYRTSVKDLEPGDQVIWTRNRPHSRYYKRTVHTVTRTTKNLVCIEITRPTRDEGPQEVKFSRAGEWTTRKAEEYGTAGNTWSTRTSEIHPVNEYTVKSTAASVARVATAKAKDDAERQIHRVITELKDAQRGASLDQLATALPHINAAIAALTSEAGQ